MEDIKFKRNKITDAYLHRVEKEEIKRAEAKAIMSYHHNKLRKY